LPDGLTQGGCMAVREQSVDEPGHRHNRRSLALTTACRMADLGPGIIVFLY
jgi:hypothetical protein